MSTEHCIHRRRFLSGSLASAVPFLCCETPDLPSECVSYEPGFIVIDLSRAAGLRHTGSAAKIVNPDQKVDLIVARTARDRWIAFNRSCTHGGAQVVYNHRRRSAQCTSLGHSEFDLQGTVLRGPAPRPLPVYEVRRTSNMLRISREAAS